MSFWKKLKPVFAELGIDVSNLSTGQLQDNEQLIPHLLEHLNVVQIEKALPKAGINVFNEKEYTKEQIVISNGSYLIVDCHNDANANALAFSTNPLSELEVFKVNGADSRVHGGIGFIDPASCFLENKKFNNQQDAVDSKIILQRILQEAINLGASDIHIRPRNSTHICFKLRLDGILVDSKKVQDISNNNFQKVVSEINSLFKVNATDLNDFKEKQSNTGKIDIFDKLKKPVDLRMQLNPLHVTFKNGQAKDKHIPNYVIRLMGSTSLIKLDDIGLTDLQVIEIKGFCRHNAAGIFVAGPTGSGKTTLAYAILSEIHKQRKGINVMSVEDPVEVNLSNTQQIEIQGNITFESALKAIKRSDPNVVFCGEIRDKVTAHKVCEIRELGNTVLTTIHAEKSFDVIDRLKNKSSDTSFSVPLDILAKTISIIIMPRLVRKVCKHCSTEVGVEEAPLYKKYANYFEIRKTPIRVENEKGCEKCSYTGYKGRIQVAEAFVIDPALKKMIVDNESSDKIHDAAIKKQRRTIDIYTNGVMLVKYGITTLSEITRALPSKSDFGKDYENDHEEYKIS